MLIITVPHVDFSSGILLDNKDIEVLFPVILKTQYVQYLYLMYQVLSFFLYQGP